MEKINVNQKIIKEFGLQNIKPSIRYLWEMEKVIYDKKWFEKADKNLKLYYMYRGIKEKKDFRYDITIIPPKMLGVEFTRTKGHHHSNSYGEIYTVLEGEGFYFMQKGISNSVSEVKVVKAKKGEVIIIPPYYTHITINPSKKILITGNWIAKKCQSIYKDLEKLGGPSYFYTKAGWKKNKNYLKVPKIKFQNPRKSLPSKLSLYLNPQ